MLVLRDLRVFVVIRFISFLHLFTINKKKTDLISQYHSFDSIFEKHCVEINQKACFEA
ncbi:hypothetical protein JCM15764A_15990 [Geotalea toluenoxydans]